MKHKLSPHQDKKNPRLFRQTKENRKKLYCTRLLERLAASVKYATQTIYGSIFDGCCRQSAFQAGIVSSSHILCLLTRCPFALHEKGWPGASLFSFPFLFTQLISLFRVFSGGKTKFWKIFWNLSLADSPRYLDLPLPQSKLSSPAPLAVGRSLWFRFVNKRASLCFLTFPELLLSCFQYIAFRIIYENSRFGNSSIQSLWQF